ncbi:hypothetical protein E2C01_062964 [Portunus trituberculatus]|uniref:Uncharacterized protein n=1 Tax=Portunus trituberculatus TaxID=210409 RepID=A0A5B7HGU8_PORTR|nr:hypothetical protein [Portunus trituberculatus]
MVENERPGVCVFLKWHVCVCDDVRVFGISGRRRIVFEEWLATTTTADSPLDTVGAALRPG